MSVCHHFAIPVLRKGGVAAGRRVGDGEEWLRERSLVIVRLAEFDRRGVAQFRRVPVAHFHPMNDTGETNWESDALWEIKDTVGARVV